MSKTALDLTPKEWQTYQPTRTQATSEVTNALVINRKQQAWQLARQASKLLREKFMARHVVLVGSLASENGYSVWSDIDLAAWGIPPERFFAAVAAVTGLSADT